MEKNSSSFFVVVVTANRNGMTSPWKFVIDD